jgi:hypothetical protein
MSWDDPEMPPRVPPWKPDEIEKLVAIWRNLTKAADKK